MKRIILLSVVSLFAYSAAFAAVTDQTSNAIADTFANAGLKVTGIGGAATNPVDIGKLSTKVDLGWITSANGYAVYTQHQQGTKAFGASHDSTSIYTLDTTDPGVAVGAITETGVGGFEGASWKTM
jgi:uncharacterized protein YcnI